MDFLEKIERLTNNEDIKLAGELRDLLNTELVLTQTRYVCRYGTLSDGHEKITDAQRYYQAIRELYNIRGSIMSNKALALEAQADLLDAREMPNTTEAEKLRKKAAILKADEELLRLLVTIEDLTRMLDEYNKVRLELMPIVRAKYPNGIEEAEPDNWEAVYNYRMIREKNPRLAAERVDNVPLPPDKKAELGFKSQRIDALAPKIIREGLSLKACIEDFSREKALTSPE